MAALAGRAMEFRMGSPTVRPCHISQRGALLGSPFSLTVVQDSLWSALLTSPELPAYLSLNRRALSRAYAFCTAWLRAQALPYTPAHAGHFVLVDWRAHIDKVELQDGDGLSAFAKEFAFLEQLVAGGVYLSLIHI